tara:strand:+ start:797 stop:1255 length:459 start_codon:yes stop_codon:yes gene_type:complete
MLYVKAIDSQIVAYPYTQTDLIRDNPSTSFPSGGISPDSMAEWNAFPVHFADQPVVDPLAQRVVELAPMYDGQSWIQQWVVEALSQDEINANAAQQAAAVRADRNARLAATDWTQIADSTADKLAWAAYRQALRDVPLQAGFPQNAIWPQKP